MWSAISVLQALSYVSLVDLYFPPNFLSFLESVGTSHDFNKWFPNPFASLFPPNKLNMSTFNPLFVSRGFKNRQMLHLCGSDFSTMLIVGVLIVILIPLSKLHFIFGKILNTMRYSSITRSLIQAYLKICLAAFINIGVVLFIFIIKTSNFIVY